MPIFKVSLVIICLLISVVVKASDVKELSNKILIQGSKIEYQKKEEQGLHQIVLSSPKRINNELFIEKDIRQEGELTIVLSSLTQATSLKQAYDFYESLFENSGEMKYQCEQRSCGVSSYWANNVFDERKLTGRDSDQYYLAGLVDVSGEKYWLSVYLVSNALRQNLIYLRYIKQETNTFEWENGSLFSQKIDLSDAWVESLKSQMKSDKEQYVYLAVYVNGVDMKSISAAKESADAAFGKIQMQLSQALELKPNKIKMHFVGPFHSQVTKVDSEIWFRVYLFRP